MRALRVNETKITNKKNAFNQDHFGTEGKPELCSYQKPLLFLQLLTCPQPLILRPHNMYYIYIYIYIYIYTYNIYTNLLRNVIVTLSHPRSGDSQGGDSQGGDSQGQKTFLAHYADK